MVKQDAAYHRAYRAQVRDEAVRALGGECACCGEDKFIFLQIDHVEGGGNAERAEKNEVNNAFLARRAGYPRDRYQILCANCHLAKTLSGGCPHREGW